MSAADHFHAAGVVTPTTGYRALRELLEARKIQRIGKGCLGNAYRYFRCYPDGHRQQAGLG